MLGKLLKYDLKWIYKIVGIFYILALFFSIIGRWLIEIQNSVILNIVGQVCIGAAIAMIINALINNLIRTWVRFIRNIYKDESYLTHTLPVKKKTIYLSKFLSAIITMFTTILVILICLAICYYSAENLESLKTVLEIAATTYNSTVISLLLVTFTLAFLQMVVALLSGYIGIILGHKTNNYKMGKSVFYGFMIYILTQVITLAVIFILGLFNPNIMNLFNTVNMIDVNIIRNIIYSGIGIYTFYIIAYYIIGNKLFEKGVNVD